MVKVLNSGITDPKYDSVDKDWIDVKSNNYFANDEYQDEKGTGAPAPSNKVILPPPPFLTHPLQSEGGDAGRPAAWFVEL